MRRVKIGNLIIKIISLVLLLALLVAGGVFLYRYTNGFNEEFKTFYLEYQGEKILSESNELKFSYGTEQKFDVKYTFDSEQGKRDYSVKIVPNVDEDFEFYLDDRVYLWSDIEDLSTYFHLQKEASSFTFRIPVGYDFGSLLSEVSPVPGATVLLPTEHGSENLFRLIVSSYNEEITYSINFSLVPPQVTLDCENIIFGVD